MTLLNALCNYYDRDKESLPIGWTKSNISFLIEINLDGSFTGRIEDVRDDAPYVVPASQRDRSITPQLMWDNLLYALDYSLAEKEILANCIQQKKDRLCKLKNKKGLTTQEKTEINKLNECVFAHEKHLSFVERCRNTAQRIGNKYIDAVVQFYDTDELKKVYTHELWNAMCGKNYNFTFLVKDGEEDVNVATIPELVVDEENINAKRCLVTGNLGDIVIKGTNTPITGCKNSAKLVSFQKNSGYDSYGKTQGENAPISKEAEFKYSSALRKLTEFGGKNNVVFVRRNRKQGKPDPTINRTYIFWAATGDATKADDISSGVRHLLNPDRRVDMVQRVFKALWSGNLVSNSKDKFYIAGLHGADGRIAVVYWNECTTEDLSKNIRNHLECMEIGLCRDGEAPYRGVYQMLDAISKNDDVFMDCPPSLPDAIIKSIIEGLPYPDTLYQACLRKLRSARDDEKENKHKVTRARVAILKAYINRKNINSKKLEAMLDEQNEDKGYLCGRLFAVLDKIQRDVNKQRTIQEGYMNAASATPLLVFPKIMNLSAYHAKKLKDSSKIFYEKKIAEIVGKIGSKGFPASLKLQEQGRFFVGYYHQLQALYPANNETTNNNTNC